ncbi:MAG: acetyl-CoA C-acyltransferase, partial [Deltaproteobacteria bacterium]
NGGAVAIGHPIGATGARLLMNMLYELRRQGGGYAMVAICGAIGQADAVIVEA